MVTARDLPRKQGDTIVSVQKLVPAREFLNRKVIAKVSGRVATYASGDTAAVKACQFTAYSLQGCEGSALVIPCVTAGETARRNHGQEADAAGKNGFERMHDVWIWR